MMRFIYYFLNLLLNIGNKKYVDNENISLSQKI